jgi:hypothetical protein
MLKAGLGSYLSPEACELPHALKRRGLRSQNKDIFEKINKMA